jgi:hypothetical protein
MNVNGNSSASFRNSGLTLDPEGKLAVLILENQDVQEDAAHTDKDLARQHYLEASEREVAALRDKAGDILKGALVQGAAVLAASGVRVGDIGIDSGPQEKPWGETGATALDGAAPVLGKYFGDAPAAQDDAEAKRAMTLAQQAEWQLDDANKVIDKVDATQTKALDWLSSVSANQASAETGIIAGFA